jgi:hypothetical protein
MKKLIHPLIALSLLASAACAPQGNDNNKNNAAPEAPVTSDITNGGKKVGFVTQTPLTTQELEQEKTRLRATSFSNLGVAPEHNATIYKLAGLDRGAKYFIAPRVFVYGTNIRSLPQTPDGQVVIPFNIALIDGLDTDISIPQLSGQKVAIPQALRVTDYQKLKGEIANNEPGMADNKFSLAGVPGCPSRISIVAAGKFFDVTPEHINESDYCELNRPFAVHLKLPPETAKYVLGDALRAGMVDITVEYGAQVPVPTSQLTVNFVRSKLFEEIQMELQGSYPPYGQAEVQAAIVKVMKSNSLNIHIQGDYDQQMQILVDKAIEQFFTPFRREPGVPPAKKCDSMVCLSVRMASQREEETFSINFFKMSNMETVKTFRIGSKLQALNEHGVNFGYDKNLDMQKTPEFSNKNLNVQTNPQNILSVGLTPQRGNVVELTPTKYSWERRKRDQEFMLSSKRWKQCTGRKGIENSCSYTTRNESLHTLEYTGEEIWADVVNPLGSVPRLLSGIQTYFRFTNGETVTCELENLDGYNEAGKRLFKVENTPRCVLFDSDRQVVSDFGLINASVLDPITYTTGQKFVTDYKADWTSYKEATYSPEVRIAGTLKLIGLGFISVQINK